MSEAENLAGFWSLDKDQFFGLDVGGRKARDELYDQYPADSKLDFSIPSIFPGLKAPIFDGEYYLVVRTQAHRYGKI